MAFQQGKYIVAGAPSSPGGLQWEVTSAAGKEMHFDTDEAGQAVLMMPSSSVQRNFHLACPRVCHSQTAQREDLKQGPLAG